jgi:hypothetical protein
MSWLIQYLIGICASLGREFPHGEHLLPEQETVVFLFKNFSCLDTFLLQEN